MFVTLTDVSGEIFTINTNHIVSIRNTDGLIPTAVELTSNKTIHIKDEESLKYLKILLEAVNEQQVRGGYVWTNGPEISGLSY